MISLALDLVGHRTRWIEDDGALTSLEPASYESLWAALQRIVQESEQERLSLAGLVERARQLGWVTTREEFARIARRRWKAQVLLESHQLINPWVSTSALYARVMKDIGEPVDAQTFGLVLMRELELEAPPEARYISQQLGQAEAVYYVDRGIYAHANALELPLAELEAIALERVESLRHTSHAVSTATLLDPQAFPKHIHISPMLLRDLMGRHERIQVFQSTDMVAHRDAFDGQRKTQLEHVEEILRAAGCALSCDELCERMPEHVSFHRGAVYACLLEARFALKLGQGMFFHRACIGLMPDFLEALLTASREVLRAQGSPLGAGLLLERMGTPAAAFLSALPLGERVFGALLAEHPEVLKGAGHLLMWHEDGAHMRPGLAALGELLGEHVVMTPAQLMQGLEREHGWAAGSGALYYVLELAERAGLVERVFGKWRVLAQALEQDIFEALHARAKENVFPAASREAAGEDELERWARYQARYGLHSP